MKCTGLGSKNTEVLNLKYPGGVNFRPWVEKSRGSGSIVTWSPDGLLSVQ